MDTQAGKIIWVDLTVNDAEGLRDFYKAVAGWEPSPVDSGGYDDYNMLIPGTETPAAGVCHARGVNADIPPQWMIYITVADLDASLEAVKSGGGKILAGPKEMGGARSCVIQDPAGAVCTLFQQADEG